MLIGVALCVVTKLAVDSFNLDNTVRNGLSTDMEKTEGIFAESAVRTVSEIEPGASVVDAEVVEHEDEEE